MRCKKHIHDISSTVGICATCLRHRLSALAGENISDPPPPPSISFPKSVSPYVTGRKTNQFRFFSTPQEVLVSEKKCGKLSIFKALFGHGHRRPDVARGGESCRGPRATRDRGMSPDYESSPWRTPASNPANSRRGRSGHVSAFCMSPLVRASPRRVWMPEIGYSGEPCLSYAKSHCANRSRKIADFGRLGYNR